MKRISILLVALVMVLGLSATANADLIVRGTDTLGNQLIYDTDLDITWYDYSNAYHIWDDQMAWAAGLTVDFEGTIYDDWRLPVSDDCSGFDCTGSEMGHLYYTELGNLAGGPLSTGFTDGLTGDPEAFLNLKAVGYWSGTEHATDLDSVWRFQFYNGDQAIRIKFLLYESIALAVRDGDVAAVPEPGTLLLLGTGLAGMALYRRFGKR